MHACITTGRFPLVLKLKSDSVFAKGEREGEGEAEECIIIELSNMYLLRNFVEINEGLHASQSKKCIIVSRTLFARVVFLKHGILMLEASERC